MSFIRDAEIESNIHILSTPLFEAANINPKSIHIHLVNDKQLNAFVAKGLNLFLNTGLIARSENVGQLIGVIAHETGHMAGGHLVRMSQRAQAAQTSSLVSTILGGAAILATGRGDVGAAIMMGGQGSIMGNFFGYTRSEENSADQASLRFLDATKQSAKGLLEFMRIIEKQGFTVSSKQDVYFRTHPLTRDRMTLIANHVENSPFSNVPTKPEYVKMHSRMRGKLIAFLESPEYTLARYKIENKTVEARYARAIANFRKGVLSEALKEIDGLIGEFSSDPYFHELKGQMLFENGKLEESLVSYNKAVSLAPNSHLIRISLAQVQTETENSEQNRQAVNHLTKALAKEPRNGFAWRLLAIANGRSGNMGMAAYAMAEYNLLVGRYSDSINQCRKAEKLLENNEAMLLRVQDIKQTAKVAQEKSKKKRKKKRRR
ncbi:MAG: M48 family metallopeptidase [Alphaproteobacteria bacterium]|nr:M48 family metallopeptidase [Alphaproteobacteria bacterium]